MIWGSDDVFKEFATFRRQSVALAAKRQQTLPQGELSAESLQALLTFEKLLYAIRADVGHKNKGLVEGDLLSLFVNDIDKYLAARNNPAPIAPTAHENSGAETQERLVQPPKDGGK
jgi:hypothetical protein